MLKRSARVLAPTSVIVTIVVALAGVAPARAQEQSRESMAVDNTATQWSFEFAWQGMPEYYEDIVDGQLRPTGDRGFFQTRFVAPIRPSQYFPLTILPRVTFRYAKNRNSEWGAKPTELFALLIFNDWGTGRWGVGPLAETPAESIQFGSTHWSWGLSGAVVNRSMKDRLLYGLLFTQSWGQTDPSRPNQIVANPLGISVFITYSLGRGWYVQNGEMEARYDWHLDEFYLPVALRVGRIVVHEKSSWNFYGEYQTSIIYDNWSRAAVKHQYRVNVSYTIPVG